MGLLIWKIIGYGVVFIVVGGIVVSVLSAVGTILLYIFYPIFIVGSFLVAVAMYPLAALLQASGYKCPSPFALWLRQFSHGQRYEKPVEDNTTKKAKINEPKKEKPKASGFDPWEILDIPRNASKQEIAAAYKKKMTLNHPDKVATLDPALQSFATQRTILLRRAYEQLVSA